MQSLTPKLGAKVVTKAFLVRTTAPGKDEHLRDVTMKVWERIEKEPIQGIYVGRRMKSNGMRIMHWEEPIEYKPVAYFEVWLVAYADNRDILVCLPVDVRLDKGDVNDREESAGV